MFRQVFGPCEIAELHLPGTDNGVAVSLQVHPGFYGATGYDEWRWVFETRGAVGAPHLRWLGISDGLLFAAYPSAEGTGGILVLRIRDGAVFRLEIADRVAVGDLMVDIPQPELRDWRLWSVCKIVDPADASSRQACNDHHATEVAALEHSVLRIRTADEHWLELPLATIEERLAARPPSKRGEAADPAKPEPDGRSKGE